MSFRNRLLIAFGLGAALPLMLLAFGVRQRVVARVAAQHERLLSALVEIGRQDLRRDQRIIENRLSGLKESLGRDERLRAALRAGEGGDRGYLLDFATRARQTTGLDFLLMQDATGRVLSSG